MRTESDSCFQTDALDAALVGHPQIENHDVGSVRAICLDRLHPILSLGDYLHVRLVIEGRGQPNAHQDVIVDNQDADPGIWVLDRHEKAVRSCPGVRSPGRSLLSPVR